MGSILIYADDGLSDVVIKGSGKNCFFVKNHQRHIIPGCYHILDSAIKLSDEKVDHRVYFYII